MVCAIWILRTWFPTVKAMNNLVLTRKRAIKAERLHKAQLATFKKGVFTSYKSSVFEERQTKVAEELSKQK